MIKALLITIILLLIALTIYYNKAKAFLDKIYNLEKKYDNIYELYKKARAEAVTDKLTGISSRRYVDQRLKEEIAHTKRENNYSFHAIFIDVNKLKEINDEYGHNKGDILIKKVAELLKGRTRAYDISGRYGGDEFVWILPNTSEEVTISVTQRLYDDINNIKIEGVGEHKFSASLGIAIFQKESLGDPIIEADKAMYYAKKNHLGIAIITDNGELKCVTD